MPNSSNEDKEKGKIVLVVEDDAGVRELVALALRTETPYRVLVAKDAFQALDITKTIAPDLLVLDYQLPRMNGLELYDRLHVQREFSNTPALFMSANAPADALQKRHIRSINKPFDIEIMLQTIEGLLAG